jgi:phage-related protein
LRRRTLYFYRNYFSDFFDQQPWRVQKKILWTLEIVETMDRIPDTYLKHLTNTDALYEIRVQIAGKIYRLFCFFDRDDLVVVGHGFQKKTQKTPPQEIKRAAAMKKQYHEEKKSDSAE